MIYAIVGIPGAGKSFLAVKTMLDYIASGGVCVSNIKFTGLEDSGESGFFRWKVLDSSPVVKYLKTVLKWEYQAGQYSYIDLDKYDENFLGMVPMGSPEKRILLILDEVNEWFDSNDRGKIQRDAKYNELFKFLRLSRHYHIDVCFVLQDFQTLNSRLRGLCAQVIQSRDLQATKIAGIPVPFPFKWFLWQYYNPKNGTPIKSITWYKDPLVFACYDSFVGFSGVPLAGQVQSSFSASQPKKKGKKMSIFERVFLYGIIFTLCYVVWRSSSRDSLEKEKASVSSVATNRIDAVKSSFFRMDRDEQGNALADVKQVVESSQDVEHIIYCDYYCFDMMGVKTFYLGGRRLFVGDRLIQGEILNLFDTYCEILGRHGEKIFLCSNGY